MFLKKFLVFLILSAIIFLPNKYLAAAPRVAVIPFENQSARQTSDFDGILEQARADVEYYILETNKFEPLDRVKLQRLLDEIKLNHTALFDPATAAQYGKMVGAQYLVLGSVTGMSKKGNELFAHLSLRMIEVETARIFLAGRGSGKSKGDASAAMEKAVEDAVNGKRGMLTMFRGGK